MWLEICWKYFCTGARDENNTVAACQVIQEFVLLRVRDSINIISPSI